MNNLKYLGRNFKLGKTFKVNIESLKHKVYPTSNAILNKTKNMDELTTLYLIELIVCHYNCVQFQP